MTFQQYSIFTKYITLIRNNLQLQLKKPRLIAVATNENSVPTYSQAEQMSWLVPY